jgi:hypothetical protein
VTVYVSYVEQGYEGNSEPIGVFDNLHDAAWCAYAFADGDRFCVKIFEVGHPRSDYDI